MVAQGPIILYLDMYTFEKVYHYSHFVILSKIENNTATIHDPWSGQKLEVGTDKLIRSISYLRNMLKISPKVIRICDK